MNRRRVLLDANLLISALDIEGSSDESAKKKAQAKLASLLADENVAVAITPLIRYEVLRGIPWGDAGRVERVRNALNGFQEFEAVRAVSELAARMFRLDRKEHPGDTNYNVEKRRFDVFHVACAKHYQLEFMSEDGDIGKLIELHGRLPSANATAAAADRE